MSNSREEKTQVLDIKDLMGETKQDVAYLIVISGQRVGDMHCLEKDIMTIGRNPDCDIVINDDGVSRRHAQLERLSGKSYKITDLGSTNGTFFNGAKITEYEMKDGDKLQLGASTVLKFAYQDTMEEKYQKELVELATRDALTRIFNRKTFMERFQVEFAHAVRHKRPLSLIIFDIDHFKNVNDTHGHQAGDYILKALADITAGTVRSEDIIGRYGGEEFVILGRETDEEKAFIFASRVRRTVERHEFKYMEKPIQVTISLGIATLTDSNYRDPEHMFQEADLYLYQAKKNGRNRVSSVLTK